MERKASARLGKRAGEWWVPGGMSDHIAYHRRRMRREQSTWWQRIHRMGAAALVVGSVGFLVVRGGCSPDVPFISQSHRAPWIAPPSAVSAELQQWGREQVPVARFSRRLAELSSTRNGPAVLQVRALGAYSVYLNGVPIAHADADGRDFRLFRNIELPAVSQDDELQIDVANRHGPPLLSLRIAPIISDPSWRVSWNGNDLGNAVVASDTRINPLAYAVETPLEALVESRVAVIAIFVAGVIAFFGLVGASNVRVFGVRWEVGVLSVAGVGWLFLFIRKFLQIPISVGFDARHHLYYIEFMREHSAVPLATDGWSVYHPPLFYAAAGVSQWAGSALGSIGGVDGATLGLKLIPFLAGFGNVWVAGALCRKLGLSSSAVVYGLLFGAVLPMNIYSAAYFSNETFHTFLAGLAMLATVDLMLERGARISRVVWLATLLGLCLVTKFTAILVTAVAGFFLFTKWLAVDRMELQRAVGRLLLLGAVAFAFAGWFYVRNWIEYGDPLMANWGNMPGPKLAWWQQPGFHTLPYFTSFGESLRHPYLSAFHSFWDSVYSTLWGDGGIAGRVSPLDRPDAWNYTFMSLGYWVAVPATGLIAVGTVRCAAFAFGDPDPRRRAAFSFLLTLIYAVLFGLLALALRLPYFAQGKASYGLVVAAPLAVLFALGTDWVDRACRGPRLVALRALLFGWLAVFAAAMFLAFAG